MNIFSLWSQLKKCIITEWRYIKRRKNCNLSRLLSLYFINQAALTQTPFIVLIPASIFQLLQTIFSLKLIEQSASTISSMLDLPQQSNERNQVETLKTNSTDDENSCDSPILKSYQKDGCKYKTQMCKNYSETGFCPYRRKCQFAHGQAQLLRGEVDLRKGYRTKKCKSFWETNSCRYGFRCQFLHNQQFDRKDIKNLELTQDLLTKKKGQPSSKLLVLLSQK